MASQVSPGVVIRERDLSNAVVVGDSAITAAFASTFARGPVGSITNISSERELIDTFGGPSEDNASDWLVASEFLQYGGRLAVVRAESGVLNATASGSGVLIKDKADFDGGVTSEVLAARYAGTDGNYYRVVLVDRGADQILTFDKDPDTTPVVGSQLTFRSGTSAEVYSYDSATRTVAVINRNGAVAQPKVTTSDEINETDDTIATFSHNGAAEAGRTPGTYTPAADAGGASFQVVIGDAGLEGGGAASGVGGSVTVTLLTAGNADAYSVGDQITLAGGDIGGGTAVVVTVATLVDDETGVSTVTPWYNNTSIASTGLKLSAIGPRPGTSAFAAENYLSDDEVHVAVVDERTNAVVERFTYVSKLSDAVTAEGASNYWRDVVNNESQYIYSASEKTANLQSTGNAWGSAAASYAATAAVPELMKLVLPSGANGAYDGYLLSGGTDDYAYTAGEIQTAYNLFLDTEASEIDFVLMGGSMSTEADTKTKAGAVIGVATSRTDCVAFVSPYVGNQVAASGGALTSTQQRDNTIAFFDTLPSTSYAVFDSGIKYTYDRFADKYRYIGCNGDIAGLCVRTSATVDDWISPAGLNRGGLRNVVKLAFNPNKADRDELYQSRVNPVVSFPGSGPVLFGDKTALASPSAFDRINVRRLFLNIEKRAAELGKQVLFEQNDAITRGGFNSAITSYLSEVQARRGLTDYLVRCDESNNTPAVIDRNEFVAELYLKPTRSINYVTVTVTATRTGVEFSEVVGR